jgi:hypothetical protein
MVARNYALFIIASVLPARLRRPSKSRSLYANHVGLSANFHPQGALRRQLDAVPGLYQITKRLPIAEDGEFHYEIRNTLEEYNRVARESDLTRT